MGKKAKKKARAPPKVKHVKSIHQQSQNDEISEDVVISEEKISCVHFSKAVDLDKVLAKIKALESIKCKECREGVHEKRGSKEKGKPGHKKGSASLNTKSESKAIWVCLECGHYACAGVGLPTGAHSHVVRHIRQTRHRLVIQWENPQLRWCFPCNALIPFKKIEENGESKDALCEVVKMIKERSLKSLTDHSEDLPSGSGTINSEIKVEGTTLGGIDARDGYVVRGLVNLGNTCFFNSILQNLLALIPLRDYFLDDDVQGGGPINSSLKKLFSQTKPEAGLKTVINPRSFFGSLCSKAPQFRGYQQHDSHELLRCLLDELGTEESSSRKKLNATNTNGNSVIQTRTVVDTVFGGETSSTVSCMECGHSSKVYEPFLDLSLPVPTKKPPPKKTQKAARGKKTKLPPKKVAKTRPKSYKGIESVPPRTTLEQQSSSSIGNAAASSMESTSSPSFLPKEENKEMPQNDQASGSGDMHTGNENGWSNEADGSKFESDDTSHVPFLLGEQAFDMTWLDILGDGTIQDENNLASQSCDDAIVAESIGTDVNEFSAESNLLNSSFGEPDLGHGTSINPWDEEVPLQVQDSQVLYIPYKEESSTADEVGGREAEASLPFLGGVEQHELDIDGFGGLFDEPDTSEGPSFGPPSRSEASEAGFVAVSSSSSDHEEIDDTDSPVSVESCLTHFTKPEILSNGDAWHCENCSNKLKAERQRAQMALRSVKLSDRDTEDNTGSLISHNGDFDSSDQICVDPENAQMIEPSPVFSNCNEEKNNMGDNVRDELSEAPQALGSKEIISGTSGVDDHTVNRKLTVRDGMNSQLAESSKFEGSDVKDMDSENVVVKRDATKSVFINKAPPILSVHLKRFSQDVRGRLSKLNGRIIFREFLDVQPYMDPRCNDGEELLYRLVGVVEHLGTMRGGHYVSYTRGGSRLRPNNTDNKLSDNNTTWYYASDAHVRQVSLEEVLRCEAYILFYEKIQEQIR